MTPTLEAQRREMVEAGIDRALADLRAEHQEHEREAAELDARDRLQRLLDEANERAMRRALSGHDGGLRARLDAGTTDGRGFGRVEAHVPRSLGWVASGRSSLSNPHTEAELPDKGSSSRPHRPVHPVRPPHAPAQGTSLGGRLSTPEPATTR